jgi:hypothetical protein
VSRNPNRAAGTGGATAQDENTPAGPETRSTASRASAYRSACRAWGDIWAGPSRAADNAEAAEGEEGLRDLLPDDLLRQLGRMSVSEGSIAAMSFGSLVMTGCPRSLAQMATLTSTMSAVRVAAQRAPTRSAILVSSGTTDVTDARSKRAIRA